jgi:hypothetical protein
MGEAGSFANCCPYNVEHEGVGGSWPTEFGVPHDFARVAHGETLEQEGVRLELERRLSAGEPALAQQLVARGERAPHRVEQLLSLVQRRAHRLLVEEATEPLGHGLLLARQARLVRRGERASAHLSGRAVLSGKYTDDSYSDKSLCNRPDSFRNG